MSKSGRLLERAELEPCFETVRSGTRIDIVKVEHISEADYFQDSVGRRWVRKVNIGWQELLAELHTRSTSTSSKEGSRFTSHRM